MITSEGMHFAFVIGKFKVGEIIKYSWPGEVILRKSYRKISRN